MGENLRGRVADRRQAGTALSREQEHREQHDRRTSLATQLAKYERQYAAALPPGYEAGQLLQDAIQALRATPKLDRVDAASFMGGLMTCAQLALRPAVLGQCWLLPFWNKHLGHHQAAFVAGYKGLKELAFRTGSVAGIHAYGVDEADVFDVDYGTDARIVHKPRFAERTGTIIGWYCVVRYVNGFPDFEYMTDAEVQAHRDRFAMHREKDTKKVTGIWVTDYEAMALKTPTRRVLSRWVPLSPQRHGIPAIQRALQVDGTVRVDLEPDADLLAVTSRPADEEIGEEPPVDGEVVGDEPTGATP